ncbi:MAG: ABC transporter ATP-binding protein [Burkholderiales bacterium]|nr:ABC transporter ATP-binding protein [Burkholderiales bacterium]
MSAALKAPSAPQLRVRDLRVEFPTRRGLLTAVDGVSFDVAPGEVLGLVGESGAGKSLTGAALIRLLEPPGRIAGGEIELGGQRIDTLPAEEFRHLRGGRIAMVFQDPLTSLNPLFTIGDQIVETIRIHLDLSPENARKRAVALLEEVGIPAAAERLDAYPHEFSGGMRQRVVIALALAADPAIVIADEPTTALDVSVQAQVIAVLKRLCRERGTSVILITHDMGVIAETADRVAVMYAGRIVEIGPVREVIEAPQHPYTRGLMGAIPSLEGSATRLEQIPGAMPRLDSIPAGCAFNPRCAFATERCVRERPAPMPSGNALVSCFLVADGTLKPHAKAKADSGVHAADVGPAAGALAPLVAVENLTKVFDVSRPWLYRVLQGEKQRFLTAVDGVSFAIPRGHTFALVGESGSGKSTVAKTIVGLVRPTAGRIMFDGTDISSDEAKGADAAIRQRLTMIFQDPYASLNPRMMAAAIVAEPLRAFQPDLSRAEVDDAVAELLGHVRLSPKDGVKFPHEFSGGQRQRIAIARALASKPEFIVCDEPTSALDVSVQAQILNLMRDLQDELGLTYLLISHNLAVVRHMANEIGVLYLGRLVEVAPAHELFSAPRHPYTRMLLAAVPSMDMTDRAAPAVQGEIPNPINPPSGCTFHPRCPLADDRCRRERPPARQLGASQVACFKAEDAVP